MSFALSRPALRDTVRLALPVVTVQVGLMLMGVVDTIMVGRVGAAALAAVAIGNMYFFVLTIFGIGVLLALDPVVSQAVGAGDEPAIARAVQRGLVIALAVSAVVSLALLGAGPVLRLARQPAEVVPDATAYAYASIPGTLPFFAFVVCRQTLQALRRMRPIVVTIVLANVVNVLFNWVLIFGNLGAPALGAVGSGWASTLARWVGAVALVAAAWPTLRPLLRPLRPEALAVRPLLRMVRLGLPVGVQQMLEAAAFGVVALLMGTIGTVEVAAHQVAINLASLTFMVPLAVGAAAAVTVGRAVGAGDMHAARRAAVAALVVGTGFMCASASAFLLVPGLFARLYTTDAAVLALAASLIPIAGVFQIADGLQAVAAGVLRGAADTRLPLVLNLVGFWMLGMPVSVYLAFRAGYGPQGLWWGLVVGLAAVAVLLLVRMRLRLGGTVARVHIDDALPAAPLGLE